MGRLEFEKTPKQKADHAAAQFGYNSLYARSLRLLAELAGEHPSEKKLGEALTIVERQVGEYLAEVKPQP